MLSRRMAVEAIVDNVQERDAVVSALGYVSREVHAHSATMRDRCFYCMGSMGSVTPLALGIALARPDIGVFALEGDGSLLMNLGTLVTVRRYGPPQLRLVIFDNGHYESTGGQPSQPDGFALEDVCVAVGLTSMVARSAADIALFMTERDVRVLVIKTTLGGRPPRIVESPAVIAARFARWLPDVDEVGVPRISAEASVR